MHSGRPPMQPSGACHRTARVVQQLHAGRRAQQLADRRPHHKQALPAPGLLEGGHTGGSMHRVLRRDDGACGREKGGEVGSETRQGSILGSTRPCGWHIHEASARTHAWGKCEGEGSREAVPADVHRKVVWVLHLHIAAGARRHLAQHELEAAGLGPYNWERGRGFSALAVGTSSRGTQRHAARMPACCSCQAARRLMPAPGMSGTAPWGPYRLKSWSLRMGSCSRISCW